MKRVCHKRKRMYCRAYDDVNFIDRDQLLQGITLPTMSSSKKKAVSIPRRIIIRVDFDRAMVVKALEPRQRRAEGGDQK